MKANKKDIEESLEIAKDLKEWFTKEAIKNMKRDFKKNLIVVKTKNVVGFLNYKVNKSSITIKWIGVKRNERKKGIGKSLLNFLIKIAKKNNIKKLRVETLTYEDKYKPYKSTREFYLKNDFKYKWIKKAKKQGHDDIVIMEKEL